MDNPISSIREAKGGISRMELSRRTGIPYLTLTNIETGLVRGMSDHTLKHLAAVSGQTPEQVQDAYIAWHESLVQTDDE